MKKLRLIPLFGFAVLLTHCVSHDPTPTALNGATILTAPQLSKLVDGSSISMEGYGQTASVEFNQNGSLKGSNRTGEKDTGQWKITENELCLRFKKWGSGDVNCYQVVEREGGKYELFNRKGMPVYDLNVVTPGEVSTQSKSLPIATDTPPPSGSANQQAQPEPILVSPHAADDINYIIRHNAQDCPGCNLAHANLSGQSLVGANLQGANLTEADLSHANLRRANLKGANLYRANLRGTDLAGADLTGANMTEATLK